MPRRAPSPYATLPLIVLAIAAVGLYVVGPALALMRLDRAVRTGDRAALARLIDWPELRKGLADQVAGGVLGAPAPIRPGPSPGPGAGLPPFGFSFVSHIAEGEMRKRLTPDALIRLAATGGRAGAGFGGARFAGAALSGPAAVTVRLRVPGAARPVRLGLRLEGGRWKLARVWLPRALLRRAAAAPAAATPRAGGAAPRR
ncbi:MAG: DUF2939 domain-containing protein [Rhodospirillales bacterium]|nr:DUF2939 domain-containing protein [Rhodospirillales bacterium]